MTARVIAFPTGVTVNPPHKASAAEMKRWRYLDRLEQQARGGDVGAYAELKLAELRDLAALGCESRVLLPRCHGAIAAIRKLRRQHEGRGKEGA